MQEVLSLDECQLILALAQHRTVDDVARALGRDRSVLTRKLAQIGRRAPVVEKRGNRWLVTAKGLELCRWTRQAVGEQRRILRQDSLLRVGTVRDFAEFILTPRLREIRALCAVDRLQVLTALVDPEAALLQGEIDLAISCARPVDPSIRRRRLFRSHWVAVASRKLLGKGEAAPLQKLLALPFLEHAGLPFRELFPDPALEPQIPYRFDSISSIRGALLAGAGWSVLPGYAIRRELQQKELVDLKLFSEAPPPEDFSVWWLRESRFAARSASLLLESSSVFERQFGRS